MLFLELVSGHLKIIFIEDILFKKLNSIFMAIVQLSLRIPAAIFVYNVLLTTWLSRFYNRLARN